MSFFLMFFKLYWEQTLIDDILTISLDDFLPSFGKLKNYTFEEALDVRSEELVLLIFNSLLEIKSFAIEMVLKGAKQMISY